MKSNTSIKRVTASVLPTKLGTFSILGYEAVTRGERRAYVVLLKGEPRKMKVSLVRIHSQCLTGDVFSSIRCGCGDKLRMAMRIINKAGAGLIIYLPEEGRAFGILDKLRGYERQDQGSDTFKAGHELGFGDDQRDYLACAEILRELGMVQIRLLSSNPAKRSALEREGILVINLVAIETSKRHFARIICRTKKG